MANFLLAIPFILANEGSYFTNNPKDTRGATKYGITQSSLTVYRKENVTAEDIKNLSEDEAKRVYKKLYWDPTHIEAINDQELATMVFDMTVLTGADTALPTLQKAYNLNHLIDDLNVDGVFGPKTIAAVNHTDSVKLKNAFRFMMTHEFLKIVEKNPSQRIFLQGWINRVNKNYHFS